MFPQIEFDEKVLDENGRCQVWEAPNGNGEYYVGSDFGYGIGRDQDWAVVLDGSVRPVRQVAELVGQYGEQFDRVLFMLCRYYRNAFLLGEHQVGGPIMARLARVYKYANIYKERREDAITKEITLRYGWARQYDDITLRNLRKAIIENRILVRSPALIDQLTRLQFFHPKETEAHAQDDDRLRMRLPLGAGGRRPSPDGVMALSYAYHAIGQRPASIALGGENAYAPGTAGAMFDHAALEQADDDRHRNGF